MLQPILSFFGLLSSNSAKWPIQTIVFIAVLASTAYFSILDFSIPSYGADSFSVSSFYHPGSIHKSSSLSWSNLSSWTPIDDPSEFEKAEKFIGAKVLFVGASGSNVPLLEDAALVKSNNGDGQTEQNIVLPESQFQIWLDRIKEVSVNNHRDVWRLRKSYSWAIWIKWNIGLLMDLIKRSETYDLTVVGIAYVAMHYTFVSLFLSMRRLGSNIWLATSVMLSSTFAFMFAYVTAHYLGVPVSPLTLSEGLPFLVITIGFESKISLTRIALNNARKKGENSKNSDNTINDMLVLSTTLEECKPIFRDYAIEIIALIAASFSGVNKLWQFCFLSAWILVYDCLLLLTFYVSILSIKVEISKIKRNEVIRNALEEDGVSHAIAESVADNTSGLKPSELSRPIRTPGVSFFKVFMILGFVLLNAVQLTNYPFSWSSTDNQQLSASLASLIPSDYENGVVLTIIPPLVFEHARLSVRLEDSVNTFLETWTNIIGDPLISKCIVLVLSVSVGLNGYLFNVARNSSVKVVEKIVEVERRVPVVVEPNTVSDTDSSEETDDGIEIKPKSLTLKKKQMKSLEDCVAVMKAGMTKQLEDEEVIELAVKGKLPLYALEKQLADAARAVYVRRAVVSRLSNTKNLETSKLPHLHYDYDRVLGACCENVIGYMPLPIGVAGPLIIDNKSYFIPMATTEGCLVASTMRGCKALNAGGGVTTVLTQDGMTRGPCVSFPTLKRAGAAKIWLDSEDGQRQMKKAFDSTSRFARLQSIKTALAGTLLFIRFRTTTGDAMGMNMISKGVEYSLQYMVENCGFHDMEVISVSGNYCTDKKPAAINWIDGRGKSVVAECIIPGNVIRSVLKSDVDALVELNISKNLVGSAMAGSVGGFNAHAANLVTAIFLATGQDPAQNVESSNCITLMKNVDGNLQISVSMPSIEVGTIGGGTILEPQGAMLDLLGVKGPHASNPGDNARQLAKIVAAGVLAAELSLCSALAAGHLVQSHMTHNRSKASTPNPGLSTVDVNRLKDGSNICIKS